MSLEAKLETNIQGTYDEDILSKFLEKHKDKLNQRGNYSIFLFIDKETFELDIKEWRSFNYFWEKFQAIGFNIIGVSTIGDDELGKVLMESNLLNIKFPVSPPRSPARGPPWTRSASFSTSHQPAANTSSKHAL